MRLLWDDQVAKYTPAYSTQAGGFPATNAQHIHLSRAWRTTGVAGEYLTLDAGAGNTITATCAAIVGKAPYPHNLSAGATLKIQAHPTDAWGGPDFEQAFIWDAATMLEFFTSTAKRFWRFYLDDPGNPDGYLHIPRLMLGAYLQMPPVEPGPTLSRITTSVVSTSLGAQPHTDRRMHLLAPAFSLPIVSQAQRLQIDAMFAAVDIGTPVLLAVWEESLDVEPPIYCRINQEQLEYRKAAEAGAMWALDLEFREAF